MHSAQCISSFLHFINEPSITPGSYQYVSQRGLISQKLFSEILLLVVILVLLHLALMIHVINVPLWP
jgi:hypothetical protein